MRYVAIGLVMTHMACGSTTADDCGGGPVELGLDPARAGFAPLDESGEVPVFIPPQGGIFTELDLHVHGVAIDEISHVRVTVDSIENVRLADQEYPGTAIPLLCLGDGEAYVPRMPIRFAEDVDLDELDGVAGELALTVSSASAEHERRWSVVLRVTTF